MSMEISSNYKDYKNDFLENVQAEQDKTKEAGKEQSAGISIPKDEYISSEKSGNKPSGLYHLGQDESGNPKVLYDNPKKAAKAKECTTNTDNVDREIENLKEQKKQLEQQIRVVAGDEVKVKELEEKLARIEGELSKKDSDTYRRRKAVISQKPKV